MKKSGKILAGVMAICLAFGVGVIPESIAPVVSITASAEEESEYTEGTYEHLTYKNYGDYIEISGCDKSATEIVIPSEIDGVPVTNIGDSAFEHCRLTSINIPDSVTNIESYAFWGCINLVSVTIPNNVTNIGDEIFGNCYNLTSINISEKNKYYSDIEGVVFNKDKTELLIYPIGKSKKEYIIPDNVISIGMDAFSDSTLESITIPNSVTSIGRGAFCFCSNLESIIIPESVYEISGCIIAFSGCNSVTILSPECNIDDDAFFTNVGVGLIYVKTIYGYENSTAQAYAEKYDIKFIALDDNQQAETATGDLNGDGNFKVSDVVMLQKYLLGDSDIQISDWKQADLNSDGVLDIFDLCLMKKKLIEELL